MSDGPADPPAPTPNDPPEVRAPAERAAGRSSLKTWSIVAAVLLLALGSYLTYAQRRATTDGTASRDVPQLTESLRVLREALGRAGHDAGAPACLEANCRCFFETLASALDRAVIPETFAPKPETCAEAPPASGAIAELLARRGEIAQANLLAERVVQQTEQPQALLALALAQLRLAEPGSAQADAAYSFAERAHKAGRGAPSLVVQGQVLMLQGKFAAALAAFERAQAEAAHLAGARFGVAQAHAALDHYQEARKGFLAVARTAPELAADCRLELGLLTHSIGATEEAQYNLQQLSALVAADDARVLRLKKALAKPAPRKSILVPPPATSTNPRR